MGGFIENASRAMKRRSVLDKQAAARKKTSRPLSKTGDSKAWGAATSVAAFFIKFSSFAMAVIMISVLFVSIYEYMLTSPYIQIKKIVVTGVEGPVKDELLDRPELAPGSSLLGLNLDKLKRAMEQNRWIQSVQLEKQFPHTLIIHVVQEEPWAVAAMGGDLYYVDRSGEIFAKAEPGRELDYPVITGLHKNARTRREQLRWATHVLRILESQKPPWSFKDISEVHVEDDGNVDLYFNALPVGIQVMAMEMDERMNDLKRLVAYLNQTGRIHMVNEINLNYREGAAVSFKNG